MVEKSIECKSKEEEISMLKPKHQHYTLDVRATSQSSMMLRYLQGGSKGR